MTASPTSSPRPPTPANDPAVATERRDRESRPATNGRARRGRPIGRRRPDRVIALTLALLAAGVGSMVGSGALNAEDRFHAARAEAQKDEGAPYGPERVYGHPEHQAGSRDWAPILRRVMALDGLN